MISGYLDPASGSAIIGAVAAGGAGIAVAAKTVLAKIGLRKKPAPVYENSEAEDDEASDTASAALDESDTPTQ